MVSDVELGKVMVADFDFRGVTFLGTRRCDGQAGFRSGAPDQCQRLFQAAQRFSCPVDTDRTKQAMLHVVPFRRARRVVGHRNRQPVGVGPLLERMFPKPGAAAVASSGIRLD